jgi:glucokinase
MSCTLAIGIDVGGTHAKIALVDDRGSVHAHEQLDTGPGATSATLAPALLAAIERLLVVRTGGAVRPGGESGAPFRVTGFGDVATIGLAVPGFVDARARRSLFSPNTPGLVGDELPRALGDATGLSVVFDSDVNTATLAEHAWGAGRGTARFLCLTLGTGVGGGFVSGGTLVRITGGTIGDIGHVILEPGGRRCSAGCAGCAEALIGSDGIVASARAAGAPAGTDRAAAVIEATRSGEGWAIRVAERTGHLVGLLLASLMPIFLPERVAIVGGTTAMGKLLIESARRAAEATGGPPYVQGRAIVEGRFGSLAGAVGAAALAFAERRARSGR